MKKDYPKDGVIVTYAHACYFGAFDGAFNAAGRFRAHESECDCECASEGAPSSSVAELAKKSHDAQVKSALAVCCSTMQIIRELFLRVYGIDVDEVAADVMRHKRKISDGTVEAFLAFFRCARDHGLELLRQEEMGELELDGEEFASGRKALMESFDELVAARDAERNENNKSEG
jgi:hypothetical protein